VKKIAIPSMDELCKMLFDRSARTVYILDSKDEFLKYRFNCKRSPKVLDDVFVTFLVALKLFNDHLIPEFEKVVQLIGSSGLLEFYIETLRWNRYTKNLIIEENDPLKVFSLEDLGFGFIPWLCALAVSFLAFLLEIIWFSIMRAISPMVLKLGYKNSTGRFNFWKSFRRIWKYYSDKINAAKRKYKEKRIFKGLTQLPQEKNVNYRSKSFLERFRLMLKPRRK
jgi:hypothetical protein